MTVRFDEAWAGIISIGRELAVELHLPVIALRDVVGRVSLLLDDRPDVRFVIDDVLMSRVRSTAAAYSASSAVTGARTLFDADAVFADPAVRWDHSIPFGRLERTVVGQEWGHQGEPGKGRVALYAFKGGVGRSTAAFMLARRAAADGQCVLVVDLDLESPGVGPLLQDESLYPANGLVDQLVESAVDNADGLELVTRSTRIQGGGNGEVWFAPAGGPSRAEYDYLARLNRVYADLPGPQGRITFAERLRSAVEACEEQVRQLSRAPDLVLLDSRAGLHDIAAVVLTQLADLNLLFAVDNRHTWSGYGMLFSQWRDAGLAPDIRERLRMVSAMTPPPVPSYLDRFRDHAQECFAEHLYDVADPDDFEAFNPAPDDPDAPHSPAPIFFSSDLVGVDSDGIAESAGDPRIEAAYARFIDTAMNLARTES